MFSSTIAGNKLISRIIVSEMFLEKPTFIDKSLFLRFSLYDITSNLGIISLKLE